MIHRRLIFMCRRFGTLCSIVIGGAIAPPMNMEQTVLSYISNSVLPGTDTVTHKIKQPTTRNADPSGRADYGVGLRPLACWDCGFESGRGRGCLSLVLCVVKYRSLSRDYHSSRGVLPNVVCLSVMVNPRQ
jgi:hypothetical protein